MAVPSYLAFALALCAAAAITYASAPARRRLMLTSAVGAAPFGLLDILFTGEYWTPDHVLGAGLSIEGVLFSFANGVLLAGLAFAGRAPAFVSPSMGTALIRCVKVALPSGAVFAAAWTGAAGFGGLSIMHAALLGLAAALAMLLALRPDLAVASLLGASGFSALYAVQLALWAAADPDVARFWHPSVMWGPRVLGFPLEEFAWAALYGGVWPLAVGYGANVVTAPRYADAAQTGRKAA